MSFNALSEHLLNLSNNLDNQMPDIIAVGVMSELMAMHKKRIFDDGLDSEGKSLGEYSTKESYVSKDKFIRKSAFKSVGKPSKNGNVRTNNKTMFLAKGYSELRDIQGRQTDHINLKYSGSLEAGINVIKDQGAALYGTTDKAESVKFEALETKYEVFGLTIEEQEFIKNEIVDQAIIVAKKS